MEPVWRLRARKKGNKTPQLEAGRTGCLFSDIQKFESPEGKRQENRRNPAVKYLLRVTKNRTGKWMCSYILTCWRISINQLSFSRMDMSRPQGEGQTQAEEGLPRSPWGLTLGASLAQAPLRVSVSFYACHFILFFFRRASQNHDQSLSSDAEIKER